ncbi:MAG: alpha-amylase family protein [Thiolinea sp.]
MYRPENQIALQQVLALQDDERISAGTVYSFHLRLAANYDSMRALFMQLYGQREDAEQQLAHLLDHLREAFKQRKPALQQLDQQREADPDWFLSQYWVGMAMYGDRFAGNLSGIRERVDYLQELGVNMIHIMPMMRCPQGANDGGYAISDFRDVDPRFGSMADIAALSQTLRDNGMLLTLDIVINHTSDEHEWAQRARAGEPQYQDYYYLYPDRTLPDHFDQSMPEIFPETAPGNFTWDDELQQWVMTVFNQYQWDLNYTNPAVLTEMLDIIFYWANQGADILRLDAPAFIWKMLGTTSQNLPQAHTILQLFRDCMQIVCPGVLAIAEAIVAPRDILPYFGDAQHDECQIAYNATFMALLWDAVATGRADVTEQALWSLPEKPLRTTWLNYVRCHDDIGLGFEDESIRRAGFDPFLHRRYLKDYFSGAFPFSTARGCLFGVNEKTGDARISGSLASLAGLELALENGDQAAVALACQRIITLHALIMAYGGIALLYYGDELATLNDYRYLQVAEHAADNRWVHRPQMDWELAGQRHIAGTYQHTVFSALQRLISLRKQLPVLADFNNRAILANDNPHLLTLLRPALNAGQRSVLVVANFDRHTHHLNLDAIRHAGYAQGELYDLYSEKIVPVLKGHLLEVPACGFYWLVEK